MARKSAGMSAVSRMCRVLETFTPQDSGLRLSEIARRAQMPVSSVHAIAHQLVAEGLLERSAGEFILGVRLWELAIRAPGTFGLREAALTPMEQAHTIIQHHVQLGILSGSDMLYIERLSSPGSVVNFTQVGGRLPWYRTSSGILLAALAEPAVQDQLLSEARPAQPPAPNLSDADMQRLMRRAQQNRFVVTEGFVHADATAISVPIMSPWRTCIASLAAVVPSRGTDVESVVKALRQAAYQAGQRLASSLSRDRL